MKICSYCEEEKPLTKEHLWPASLHRRNKEANAQQKSIFWLLRLGKEIPSEPQIKDVCEKCNNGVLSDLDGYACDLFDSTFIHLPEYGEEISFSFDYHKLKRWLLKVSYNSARVNKSPDLFGLEALVPYMLGHSYESGKSVQLFVQLSYPEEVDAKSLSIEKDLGDIIKIYPENNRAGHVLFKAPGIGEKFMRAIHLRSFTFLLAYWKPGGGHAEKNDFEKIFAGKGTGIKLLRPSRQDEKLICNGVGAWESLRHSRNKFEFAK